MKTTDEQIEKMIANEELSMGSLTFCVLGTAPLILAGWDNPFSFPFLGRVPGLTTFALAGDEHLRSVDESQNWRTVMAAKTKKETTIDIVKVNKGRVTYCLLGTTPIWLNRMSQKAWRELLMPKGRKTAADKAANLKHIPMEEYRSSPYLLRDENAPTMIAHLATAFKKAMSGAAVDLPGSSRAQIGRLMWVQGERIPLFGIPQLGMTIVRSADMNKTPDVRTRAIIPEWAAYITVEFVKPLLKETSISNLLATAGITQGVGDWRPEKGSGTYGSFEIVNEDDPRFQEVIKVGGRAAQRDALENPEFYDDETEELYGWYLEEAPKRGFDPLGGKLEGVEGELARLAEEGEHEAAELPEGVDGVDGDEAGNGAAA